MPAGEESELLNSHGLPSRCEKTVSCWLDRFTDINAVFTLKTMIQYRSHYSFGIDSSGVL